MTHHHRSPDPSLSSTSAAIVPPILLTLMAAFREFFTAPVWDHVLVLGAVLTTGKRTVSAAQLKSRSAAVRAMFSVG
jgi:hypothetical protein